MEIPYVRTNETRCFSTYYNDLNRFLFIPHRVDGPALEYSNGIKSYWINGTHYPRLDIHNEDGSVIPETQRTFNIPPKEWLNNVARIQELQETSR